MGKPGYRVKKGLALGRPSEISIKSTPGFLVGAAGAFLAIEGAISILFSQDQQAISSVGRATRIGIGLSLMGWVASKS